MYDYIFGTKKHIYKNPEEFLLFVKRLLPKHCNSIPDSLAITIFQEVRKIKKNDIILETGCGASTIAIFLACCITNKKFISYDISKQKILFIKDIINQSICKFLKIKVSDHWRPKICNSLSTINGIPSLKKPVIFSYIDSSHDKLHIEREIQCIKKKVNKTTYIMFDDMHLVNSLKNNRLNDALKYKKTLKNFKLDIFKPKINNNRIYFSKYLELNFKKIKSLETFYSKNFTKDLYYKLYGLDYFYNQVSELLANKYLSNIQKNNLLKSRVLYIKADR
jgi:hypothetical protein